MIIVNSSGLGKPATFDIASELETWDEKSRQITEAALAGSKGGINPVVILIAVVGVLFVAGVGIVLLKRKKPVSSVSPVHVSSASFCTHCGNPVSYGSSFCSKCGQRHENG